MAVQTIMKLKGLHNLQFAYTALITHKLRSLLTILGISIGIAVVITIMAAGRGLDSLIMGETEVFSPDLIQIEIKVPSTKHTSSENAVGQSTGISITSLKYDNIAEVAKNENISAAYGFLMGQAVASYENIRQTVLMAGEGYNFTEVQKFDLAAGRIFTKDEEDSLAQVVVLGSKIKETLFGEDDAIGKSIRLKGKPFRVVGVAVKQGSSFFMDMDNLIIMPTKTMQKRILGIDYVSAIMAKMKDRSKGQQTVDELNFLMRDLHKITDPNKDDFAITTMDQAMDMIKTIVSGLTFLLVALVCVSLVVGGVGIMNIMYVSVTERTFEIGLRKAVGAKGRDILLQFLEEAIMLTVSGAIVGIILGAILAFIIHLIATSYGYTWIFSIPLSSIFLSVGFSAVVGLVFGLYPARKASNLNPVDALRRE